MNAMRKLPETTLPPMLRFAPWVLLLASVMAGLIAWRIAHRPDTPSLLPLLLWQIVVWLPWLAYYPAIDWLAGRTRQISVGSLMATAVHVAAATAIAASHLAWYWQASSLLSPLRGLPETKYGAYAFFFVFWFLIDLILYLAVVIGLDRHGRAPHTDAGAHDHVAGDRARNRYTEQFIVRSGRTRHVVPAREIRWIEAQGYYAALHADSGVHLIRQSLAKLEQSLDPAQFVRIHRSTIVNARHVSAIRSDGNGALMVSIRPEVRRRASRAGYRKLKGGFPHLL